MTARVLVVVLAVAGCGRIGFDPRLDGTATVSDGADTSCWPSWRAGTISPTQREVTELEIGNDYLDPALTKDALGMYYSIVLAATQFQVYASTRPDRSSPWAAPSAVTELASSFSEEKLSVTADDLFGVHVSNRGGSYQLWTTARGTTTDPFGPLANTLTAAIDVTPTTFDPELSADGLSMYYAPATAVTQYIARTSRASRVDAFGAGVTILQPTGAQTALADPTVSPDELVLVVTITTNSDPGILAYATRATTSDAFGALTPIPNLNTGAQEGNGELSFDGCELYFTRALTALEVASFR